MDPELDATPSRRGGRCGWPTCSETSRIAPRRKRRALAGGAARVVEPVLEVEVAGRRAGAVGRRRRSREPARQSIDVGERRPRARRSASARPDPVCGPRRRRPRGSAEVDRQRAHPGLVADLRRCLGDQRRRARRRRRAPASRPRARTHSPASSIAQTILRADRAGERRAREARCRRPRRARRPPAPDEQRSGRSTRPCLPALALELPRADARSPGRAGGARDRAESASANRSRYGRAVAEHEPSRGCRSKEGRGWRIYVLAVAGFLLAILIIQNAQKVTVDFLFVETETPLIFALLIAGGARRADRLGAAARSPQPPRRARARRARPDACSSAELREQAQQRGANAARCPGRSATAAGWRTGGWLRLRGEQRITIALVMAPTLGGADGEKHRVNT